jgi:hypothetical protein
MLSVIRTDVFDRTLHFLNSILTTPNYAILTETLTKLLLTEEPPPTDPPFNICDISLCEFGRCVEVDGNATCQCNPICPLIYNPVCGTNNKTYPSPCVMESEACVKKQHIRMQYPGECGKEIIVVAESTMLYH